MFAIKRAERACCLFLMLFYRGLSISEFAIKRSESFESCFIEVKFQCVCH